MQHNQQQFMRAAARQARVVRRNTGRIVFAAFGFGLAYFLDTEHGDARRERLRRSLHHAVATRYSVLAPVADDSPPVFHPLLEGAGARDDGLSARQRSEVG